MCRPSTAISADTRRPAGSVSASPGARRARSSQRSTSKPTQRCSTPTSSSDLPISGCIQKSRAVDILQIRFGSGAADQYEPQVDLLESQVLIGLVQGVVDIERSG